MRPRASCDVANCEGGDNCGDYRCPCSCHGFLLEQVRRTYDADELGIDQEDD